MKKILFGLIATVLFSIAGNAQTSKLIQGKMISGTEQIDLEPEILSSLKYSASSSDFITSTRYSEKLNGVVTVVTDNKNKVVGIILPTGLNSAKMGPIAKCMKGCMGDSGSESGAWLCYWVCIWGL